MILYLAYSVPSTQSHFSIRFRTMSKPARVVCEHTRQSCMTWNEICLHIKRGLSLHRQASNPQVGSCTMGYIPDVSRTRSQKDNWVFTNDSDSNPNSVGKRRILSHRCTNATFFTVISAKCNQVMCGLIHNHFTDRTQFRQFKNKWFCSSAVNTVVIVLLYVK